MDMKLNSIRKLNFFKSLNDSELEIINSISNIVKHTKNSILYYENDSLDKIYFLIAGLVKIYKIDKFGNEIFLYHISENSIISELTSLQDDKILSLCNAEFLEQSTILEINFSKLKKHFLSQNRLNNEFTNEILLQSHKLHSVINRELVFDATAKVAYMLDTDLNMFNKLKRQEVSFMLHIQPETLSRVLKKLKRSNIIETIDGKLIITDKTSLKEIYKGEREQL